MIEILLLEDDQIPLFILQSHHDDLFTKGISNKTYLINMIFTSCL
jgi:hypothetical protein